MLNLSHTRQYPSGKSNGERFLSANLQENQKKLGKENKKSTYVLNLIANAESNNMNSPKPLASVKMYDPLGLCMVYSEWKSTVGSAITFTKWWVFPHCDSGLNVVTEPNTTNHGLCN